jgi:hypothetical protein
LDSMICSFQIATPKDIRDHRSEFCGRSTANRSSSDTTNATMASRSDILHNLKWSSRMIGRPIRVLPASFLKEDSHPIRPINFLWDLNFWKGRSMVKENRTFWTCSIFEDGSNNEFSQNEFPTIATLYIGPVSTFIRKAAFRLAIWARCRLMPFDYFTGSLHISRIFCVATVEIDLSKSQMACRFETKRRVHSREIPAN